jgi:hypothetical protein
MGREYNVIDADGHILAPVDLWDNYMEPTFRARAPRLFVDTDSKDRLNIDGTIIGGPRGLGRLGAIGMPTVGVDRFESRGARHIISHTMEMMLVAVSVIWGGVCERFPKVRIGFLESDGGWVAPWLDRMDRHFDDQGLNDSGLQTRPSELFQRHSWISFEPVERSLDVLAESIGPHKMLWATDYPHPDGFFPGAPAPIAKRPGRSAVTKRGILAGGAQAFYGLEYTRPPRPGVSPGVPRETPVGAVRRRRTAGDATGDDRGVECHFSHVTGCECCHTDNKGYAVAPVQATDRVLLSEGERVAR